MHRIVALLLIALMAAASAAQAQDASDRPGMQAFESMAEIQTFFAGLEAERERQLAEQERIRQERLARQREICSTGHQPEIHRREGGSGVTIAGRVSSLEDEDIPGARVSIDDVSLSVSTDNRGHFRLHDNSVRSPVRLTLATTYIGYGTNRLEFTASPGDSVVVRIVMCESQVGLEEVVVSRSSVAGEYLELNASLDTGAEESITNVQHEVPSISSRSSRAKMII